MCVAYGRALADGLKVSDVRRSESVREMTVARPVEMRLASLFGRIGEKL
jgi:hypothetical protein